MRAWTTRRRRVGITGIGSSGKSVLLTSLLAHLENHEPERMPIGEGGRAEVLRFRTLPLASLPPFDHEGFRRTMVDRGRWPSKSRDTGHVEVAFSRSDRPLTEHRVHFFDFAGERMADAGMLRRDYAAWSDAVVVPIFDDPATACLAGELGSALASPSPSEAELIDAYRLTLARFAFAFRPFITPSTFLLDTAGTMARGRDADEVAASRSAGRPGEEFVPLPPDVRRRCPGLAERFAGRYERYRREVVLPVFSFLRRCHRLIVLVDVPGILMGGTGRYNDHRAVLRQLLAALDSRRGLLHRVAGATVRALTADTFRPPGISRVAIVGSKADLVHPDDRTRLSLLLREMARRLVEESSSWKSELFLASAVVSTRPVRGPDRELAGQLVFDESGAVLSPDEPPRRYTVSPVPDRWPEEWEPGRFVFPEVYPVVPRRLDLPPRQFGLGPLLDFVLREDLLE